MALLSFDAAKVRRFHCGGRIFRGLFFDSSRFFLRGHVVMMVMVKMVKIEMEKKEKCSIIYNIYIFIYYSIKMALPKIDFDQNDHDHFDHDTGAVQPHRNLDSGEKCVTWCQARCYMGEITRAQICALVKNLLSAEWMVMEGHHFVATPHTRREPFRCACVSYCRFVVTKWHSFGFGIFVA